MKQDVKREFFPSWIRNLGLEPGPFALYVSLMSRRDIKTGQAWPTVETLTEDTGMSKMTIHRHLRSLIADGYISRASGNSQAANRYTIWEPGANIPTPKKFTAKINSIKLRREGYQNDTVRVSKSDHHHIPEINTKDQNQYSPNTSEQRSKANSPILGKPEIEAILEALNLPDSIYGHVHARMEAMKWRTPENRSFRSRASASRFLEGLAGRMEPLKT